MSSGLAMPIRIRSNNVTSGIRGYWTPWGLSADDLLGCLLRPAATLWSASGSRSWLGQSGSSAPFRGGCFCCTCSFSGPAASFRGCLGSGGHSCTGSFRLPASLGGSFLSGGCLDCTCSLRLSASFRPHLRSGGLGCACSFRLPASLGGSFLSGGCLDCTCSLRLPASFRAHLRSG